MKVELIRPCGFCKGVVSALAIAEKAKTLFPNVPIHIIGNLVHNEITMERLKREGFLLIDERKENLANYLSNLKNGEVIVFSAHGHSPRLDEITKSKGLIVFDATCEYVKKNALEIYRAIKEGNEVIYLGVKGHVEAISAVAINPQKVHLFLANKEKVPRITSINPLIIAQTTLANEEIEESLKIILSYYPHAINKAKCCDATNRRQKAIEKASQDIDCFIIIGSETSNNTKKLANIAKNTHPSSKVFLCLTIKEVQNLNMNRFNHIALASGASSDIKDLMNIYQYLLNLANN